ncbi:hypothetical protein IU500_26970 [Nocardia terpenica]|nr:hypothetical protein [Nocardia terpenica]MBF6061549.1 hypothetical protein [Nocardia terpenica]MBF6107656.1 hypothetical protein [Nocardia terpenica]MBF6109969.1 hypothetical protein [Nocardia terpenica]MBF6122519.1 hypothetical protein [Nocardia terpenica]MBF6152687.1 hypothetical protein [Nocardia terpenica]
MKRAITIGSLTLVVATVIEYGRSTGHSGIALGISAAAVVLVLHVAVRR